MSNAWQALGVALMAAAAAGTVALLWLEISGRRRRKQ